MKKNILYVFFLFVFMHTYLLSMQDNNQACRETIHTLLQDINLKTSYKEYLMDHPKIQNYIANNRDLVKNILITEHCEKILLYYNPYAEILSQKEYEHLISRAGEARLQGSFIAPDNRYESAQNSIFSNSISRQGLLPEELPYPFTHPTLMLDCGPCHSHLVLVFNDNDLEDLTSPAIVIWDKYQKKICQIIRDIDAEPIIHIEFIQTRTENFSLLLSQHRNSTEFKKYIAMGNNYRTFTIEQLVFIAKIFEGMFFIPADYRQAYTDNHEDILKQINFSCNNLWQEAWREIPEQTRLLLTAMIQRWPVEKKSKYLQQSFITSLRQRSGSLISQLTSDGSLFSPGKSPKSKSPEATESYKITRRPIGPSSSLDQIPVLASITINQQDNASTLFPHLPPTPTSPSSPKSQIPLQTSRSFRTPKKISKSLTFAQK